MSVRASTSRGRSSAGRASAGMTLLEVVLAAALLALLAGTLAGAASTIESTRTRQKHQLASAEVANALILSYIDDKETLPGETAMVPYGDSLYRWSMHVEPARVTVDRAALADETFSRRARNIDRIEFITVRVWLGEDHGGSFRFDPAVPNATLSRLYDPLGFSNPDSMQTRLQTEEGMMQLFDQLMNAQGGEQGSGQQGGQGNGQGSGGGGQP